MRDFDFVMPRTLDEAMAILARGDGQEIRALAGGTDLIDQMKQGRKSPGLVMDVKQIPEMRRLSFDADGGLRIGAAATCTDIASYPPVREHYPAVAEACSLIGSTQVQNRASVGGNICNAAPSADTAPPLLVHGAVAVVAGPSGGRELSLEEFFVGPGTTVLAPNEVLLEVRLPPPTANSASHYLRFIPREEMDIAVAGVGGLLALEP
ncbi:MAG: FAD binding domain-containing protein, partial [Dehalococcoidia bacterium]